MRYVDGPTTVARATIHAPAEIVWGLSPISTSPRSSPQEFQGADWIDPGPALGATFAGRNAHAAIGAWQTTSTVTRHEPPQTFEWAIGDPAQPSARWRFTLEPTGDGVVLTQWMQMGPAPSGLTPAIEAMPDKEERIIARRLHEHQANMQATVDGVKAIAEHATDPTATTPPTRNPTQAPEH